MNKDKKTRQLLSEMFIENNRTALDFIHTDITAIQINKKAEI